jgi:hypothetical protein
LGGGGDGNTCHKEAPRIELHPKEWIGMFVWVVTAVMAPWVVLLGGVVAERWMGREAADTRHDSYQRR